MKQEQKNTFDKKLDMLHEEVKRLDALLKDRKPDLITWCSMVNERIENIWILYTKRDILKVKF